MKKTRALFFVTAMVSVITIATQAQNVGINLTGASADSSAMLDVNAANKGLLIPNVALTGTTDANTITTPAVSLLVYNTATAGTTPNDVTPGYYYNAGTTGSPVWTRLSTSTADGSETKVTAGANVTVTGAGTIANPYVVNAISGGTHYLGEEFLNGIICNLYTTSDGTQHGLIVSKTETTATWGGSSLVGANRTEDGAYNMTLMPTGAGTARTWVEALGAGWYLPSIDELTILWNNRYYINKTARAAGYTLLSSGCWSSTEYNVSLAYYGATFTSAFDKTNAYSVRAVRAF